MAEEAPQQFSADDFAAEQEAAKQGETLQESGDILDSGVKINSTVSRNMPELINFGASLYGSIHRAELQEDPGAYDRSMENGLIPMYTNFSAAVPLLEAQIANASEDDQRIYQARLDNIQAGMRIIESKFGPDHITGVDVDVREGEDEWFDEMYEPFEGGFRLRDRGEGGAIPVRGAIEWAQRQTGEMIDAVMTADGLPQIVTTEQAAEMRGGAVAVASGDYGVTYSQEEGSYVAVNDAAVSYETYMDSPTLRDGSVVGPSISHGSISQGSFNSTNQRPNIDWTGRIRADSVLGRRLLQQFGEEDDNFRKVIEITAEHTGPDSDFSYMRGATVNHGYLALSARQGTQLYLLFDKPENGVQAGVENALSSMVWYMNTTATDIAARWLGVTDTNAEAEGGNAAVRSYAGVINNSLGADGFDLLDDDENIKMVDGKPFDPDNPNEGLATLYALWVTMAQHEASNNLDASEVGLENWAKAMKSGGADFATTGGIGMRTPCFANRSGRDGVIPQIECTSQKRQEEVPWTDAQVDAFVDTVSFASGPGGSVTITIGDPRFRRGHKSVTFNSEGSNA